MLWKNKFSKAGKFVKKDFKDLFLAKVNVKKKTKKTCS